MEEEKKYLDYQGLQTYHENLLTVLEESEQATAEALDNLDDRLEDIENKDPYSKLEIDNLLEPITDKLNNIEEFAEVNVLSDWNQTDTTADDYIKNKPNLNLKVDKTTTINGHELSNNIIITKSDISLNNVTNDSQVKRSEMGSANGVATLDENGIILSNLLPSYVDDVIEAYYHGEENPLTGEIIYNMYKDPEYTIIITPESGKIYMDILQNVTYRWGGSTYVPILGGVTLGETSSTAYRGDRGKIAYDHSLTIGGNPHNVTKTDVGLSNVVNTGDSATPILGGITKFTTGGAYVELNKKVDKIEGKGLSTNDYTTDEKNKLAGIAAGAEVNVQSDWNATSGDAFIKNKPTKVSQLTNDSGYITSYTDTKNTAGTTNKTATKMFLVGATSQATNPQTYSNSNVYIGTDNCLYSNGTKVLTSHQSLSNYVKLDPGTTEQTIKSSISTISKGVINLWRSSGNHVTFLGFSNGTTETYLGGIGFKSQEDTNLYHRAAGGSSYKIWDENNDGASSGLDADLLDGRQGSEYAYINTGATGITKNSDLNDILTAGTYTCYDAGTASTLSNTPYTGGNFRLWHTINTKDSNGQWSSQIILAPSAARMFIRAYEKNTFHAWKEFAFTTSNVASATKLKTARTIWGQSFDGSANISGSLSGVSEIDFSNANGTTMDQYGNITLKAASTSTSYWVVRNVDGVIGIVMTAAGNVGIGTNSPTHKLDVEGTLGVNGVATIQGYILVDRVPYGALSLGTQLNILAARSKNAGTGNYSQDAVISTFGSGETGTTVNNFPIRLGSRSGATWISAGESGKTFSDVNTDICNTENLYLTADGNMLFYAGLANDSTNYASKLVVHIDGTNRRVAINKSSASYPLDVSGNCGATNFYTTSDLSKKDNITSLSEHIRKFTLKETGKEHYGVIAQEVEEMFREGEEGSYTVNYNSILSYYVGLLENRVAELENKVKELSHG